jgi:hypothetical protein
MTMRGLPLYLSLVPLVFAGCKASEKRAESSSDRDRVAVRAASASEFTRPAESEPSPPPPPPEAMAVARSVSPEPSVVSDHPSFSVTDEVAATAPPASLPRQLQTCPVDPLLSVLSGSKDAQTQQDAMNVVALMLATGTVHALRSSTGSGGGGGGMHRRNVANGIDDVIQTDDDQSAASKQMRPPVLFTLGWKY